MAKLTGLDALLGATVEQESQVYIPRLKVEFTVRAISNEELRKATDQATHRTGRGEKKVDERLFNLIVIAKGCADPDFGNRELIEKYDAADAADCVAKALLPGEVAKVLKAILDLSGFGDDEELINEAKN